MPGAQGRQRLGSGISRVAEGRPPCAIPTLTRHSRACGNPVNKPSPPATHNMSSAIISRRHFLALLGGMSISGCLRGPMLFNPCLPARLPESLANHELARPAFDGLRPDHIWDGHVHLLGTGDSGFSSADSFAMSSGNSMCIAPGFSSRARRTDLRMISGTVSGSRMEIDHLVAGSNIATTSIT